MMSAWPVVSTATTGLPQARSSSEHQVGAALAAVGEQPDICVSIDSGHGQVQLLRASDYPLQINAIVGQDPVGLLL